MSRQRKYKKKTCRKKKKGGTRKRGPPSRYDPYEIASQPQFASQPQLKRQKSRTQQPTQGPTPIIAPTQGLTPAIAPTQLPTPASATAPSLSTATNMYIDEPDPNILQYKITDICYTQITKQNTIEFLKSQIYSKSTYHQIIDIVYNSFDFRENKTQPNYLYYCRIENIHNSNEFFYYDISESILKRGINIQYINSTTNNIEFNDNVDIPILTITYSNKDFFNASHIEEKANINTTYHPNLKLYENWWNIDIFERIKTINKKQNKDVFNITFNNNGNCEKNIERVTCEIHINTISNYWRVANKNQLDLEKIQKINTSLGITTPKIEPTIMVTDDIIKNNLYQIIKDTLSKHISLRQSTIGNTIGNARTEVEKLGFNIDKISVSPCSYIINASLLDKLNDISPTSTNCLNGYLTKGCICYGSQIIPQGITAGGGRYTLNNSGTVTGNQASTSSGGSGTSVG